MRNPTADAPLLSRSRATKGRHGLEGQIAPPAKEPLPPTRTRDLSRASPSALPWVVKLSQHEMLDLAQGRSCAANPSTKLLSRGILKRGKAASGTCTLQVLRSTTHCRLMT